MKHPHKTGTSPRKAKKRLWLLCAAAVLLLSLSAVLCLTVFRPQTATLYRRISAFLSVKHDPEYAHYRDPDGKIVIRLDPGHGGSDPGALSPYLGELTESDINYRLSRLLRDELERFGYTVIFTWDENTPPSGQGDYPYQERSAASNADSSTDLYISLHCNSFTDPSVGGSRLYFCPDSSPYNYYLARSIADGVKEVHDDFPALYPMPYESAFYVIKYTKAPSVLLETLFLSNPDDAEKLLSEEWLAKEAEGIARGIRAFLSDR